MGRIIQKSLLREAERKIKLLFRSWGGVKNRRKGNRQRQTGRWSSILCKELENNWEFFFFLHVLRDFQFVKIAVLVKIKIKNKNPTSTLEVYFALL